MSGIKKSIVFFTSFFVTLVVLSIISYFIRPLQTNLGQESINLILYPAIYSIAFIFFILFQGIVKYIITKKILKDEEILMTVGIDKFNLSQRLWFLIIIGLIYFVQLFRNFSFSFLVFLNIILFLITLAIFELLIRYSIKTIKIHFLKQGILIEGFDIRIELPFMYGTQVYNDSGYYSYNDIDGYLIFPDHIELFLILEQGKITFKADNELRRQLMGIFNQQNIKMRTYV